MAKIWQKGYEVDKVLEEFSVGLDYMLDRELVAADCAGSVAHARMLAQQGYLDSGDARALEKALREIYAKFHSEGLVIPRELEDAHSAIEQLLIEKTGDAGKRIHLGRSRNDQVMTMLRLYGREYLLNIREAAIELTEEIRGFAADHEHTPMPGRTHMQIAMPSTLGLWAAAYAEELADDYELLNTAYRLYDRSPLGTAAGYGVPLNIDREFTASLMGFPEVQNNIQAVQNSRGKLEGAVCDALSAMVQTLSKAAQDLILFSLPEFGYVSLPDELCTGSSIMPQKKNPDGLELLRSRAASMYGWSNQIHQIIQSLPGGYNRDLQDSKEPFLRSLQTALPALKIMTLSFRKLVVHEDRLRSAVTPELFATDEAIKLVEEGMSFRDAYRQVGTHLDALSGYDIDTVLQSRTSTGYSGNLGLDRLDNWLGKEKLQLKELQAVHYGAMTKLLGEPGTLIRRD